AAAVDGRADGIARSGAACGAGGAAPRSPSPAPHAHRLDARRRLRARLGDARRAHGGRASPMRWREAAAWMVTVLGWGGGTAWLARQEEPWAIRLTTPAFAAAVAL